MTLQHEKDALRALLGKPVRNEAYARKERAHARMLLSWLDVSEEALARSREQLTQTTEQADTPKSALWLLVNFTHPYGGVFTVLRIADFLQRNGWQNRIVVYDNPDFDISPQLPLIQKFFPALTRENFFALRGSLNDLPPADAGFATFWPSAYRLIDCAIVQKKVYLVQDNEAAFYPAGTQYALAENTYRLPLHRVYNTPGLMHFLEANYPVPGARAMSFTPAADARYFHEPKPLGEPIRVLFYARPSTPRNAYELAAAFAEALKRTYGGRVHLVAAGEPERERGRASGGAPECAAWEHAGIVPYDELPQFYASFHVIVSFMLTKHPSYLPFEAMASGCAVLSNLNEANEWLLHDGENCVLAMPTVSSLLAAFARAIEPDFYARITRGGKETAEKWSWEEELRRIEAFLSEL